MTAVYFGVSTRSFHYTHTIGNMDYAGASLRNPMDLAIGQEDMIYVVNRCRQERPQGVRVSVLTIEEDFIREIGHFGEGDGELVWPVSIDLDSDEKVYVADQWLNRISIFDREGVFLNKWGETGDGDGQLTRPFGITFDKDDNLYVVDSDNNRVQKFTKDGKFLAKWGEAGNGPGQFNLPWGITIDQKGDVYVADWRNDRIQKFTADGEFLAEFGSSGTGAGQFNHPTGVAVDKVGDIYVTDWRNNRVEVLTPDGRRITSFTGDATLSKWGKTKMDANPDLMKQRNMLRDFEPEKRFWNPVAVEIDAKGRILVVDCNRHRIQVYQKDNY